MTIDSDDLRDGMEATAKVVKLTASDWRKMTMVIFLLFIVTAATAYQMASLVIKSEVERIDSGNHQLVLKTDKIETRLEKVEGLSLDVAVIKNDLSWLRKWAEEQRKSRGE